VHIEFWRRTSISRGSVLGYVDCNTGLDHSASVKELIKNVDQEDVLIETLKGTIGSYYIAHKSNNKIKIFVSPRGPGFLCYEKDGRIIIADNDHSYSVSAKGAQRE
jgi:hypothetical protein